MSRWRPRVLQLYEDQRQNAQQERRPPRRPFLPRPGAAALALGEDDADNDTAAAPPLEAFWVAAPSGGGAEHGASSNAGLGSGGGSTSGAGVAGGGALHWEQACNGRRWWRCIGALHWEQAIFECLYVWFSLLLIVCKGYSWEISPAHNPFFFQPVGGV